MNAENPHTVTVTTGLRYEGTDDERRYVQSVTFTCTAPSIADCRRYPDCDCDVWRWNDAETHDRNGHLRTPGHECWLADWFAGDGHCYTGDDFDDMRDDCVPAIDRSGTITTRFVEEHIEWDFEAAAPGGESNG